MTKEQESEYRECWSKWKGLNIIENSLRHGERVAGSGELSSPYLTATLDTYIKEVISPKRQDLSEKMMELEEQSDGQYKVGCHINYR